MNPHLVQRWRDAIAEGTLTGAPDEQSWTTCAVGAFHPADGETLSRIANDTKAATDAVEGGFFEVFDAHPDMTPRLLELRILGVRFADEVAAYEWDKAEVTFAEIAAVGEEDISAR